MIKTKKCTICGLNYDEFYKIVAYKKDFNICKGCLDNLYNDIGKTLVPKSPESMLKKDNKIKEKEFNETW